MSASPPSSNAQRVAETSRSYEKVRLAAKIVASVLRGDDSHARVETANVLLQLIDPLEAHHLEVFAVIGSPRPGEGQLAGHAVTGGWSTGGLAGATSTDPRARPCDRGSAHVRGTRRRQPPIVGHVRRARTAEARADGRRCLATCAARRIRRLERAGVNLEGGPICSAIKTLKEAAYPFILAASIGFVCIRERAQYSRGARPPVRHLLSERLIPRRESALLVASVGEPT